MPFSSDSGSGASAEHGSESDGQRLLHSDTLEGPHDAFEEAKRKVVAEVLEAREDADRQLRKRLCHLVSKHEGDRAIYLDRILVRISLEYSKDVFQRLKNYIRFPQFVNKIDYYQGGTSSVAFTDQRPPGYWQPKFTLDDPLDQVTPRVDRSIAEEVSSFLRCIFVVRCLMSSSGLTLWLRKMHSANRLSSETEPSRRPNRTASSSSKTTLSARRQPPRKRSPAAPSQRVQKSPSTRRKPPTTPSKPRRRSTKDDNLQYGEPSPIWTSSATKILNDKPSLVFSYNLGVEDRYYILHCPTETCDFLFRTHPFHENLAFNHFRECGVDFKDEADIVRRYGRLCKYLLTAFVSDSTFLLVIHHGHAVATACEKAFH
ncbi:hypothetical protein CDEST_07099 [Colletotrichum destructivum]|uniref:Uncharacterized protein n=1 Tax=Colletotrichum destructivum TaxID=34406 RepID=A0AAX4IFH6_9PEZI|nr:hypothetical protein CDEST_07099 [Colletotrichum destructivum]